MFEEEEEEEENEHKRYRDEPLHTEKIFSDRKTFFIDLKANNRGKFLKITEDVRGRRDTIMLPAETLEEFIDAQPKRLIPLRNDSVLAQVCFSKTKHT